MLKMLKASLRAAAAACLLIFMTACSSGGSGGGGGSIAAVAIVTTSLPPATVGAAYGTTIAASGGTMPYTFAVSSGTLPAWLTLSTSGSLSGTPPTAGTVAFTVTVKDANAHTASQPLTLAIASAAYGISISPTVLTSGTAGALYSATVSASGGTAPYIFSAGPGTPPGLTFSAAGILSGTPTAAGTFGFTVSVADSAGLKASANLSVVVAPAPPLPVSITAATLPSGNVGGVYTATIVAANGTRPYTFSISSGVLPGGLSISPTGGTIAGSPTATGTYPFTVQVKDATGATASAPFSITINATATPLTLGPATLPTGTVNMPYSTILQVAGGTPPYHFTQVSGSYPPGFTLIDGTLSGTSASGGIFTFTLNVKDSASPQQSVSTTFTVGIITATVAVNTGTVLATVPQTFFGLHTSVYDTALNDTARLPALLAATGITTLRYPGGNYSDRYHWAQYGVTPPHASTPPVCNLSPQDVYLEPGADFGSFVKTLLATGTQGLITVNYGTSVSNSAASLSPGSNHTPNHCSEPNTAGQPQEAAAWVAYANGLPTNTQTIGPDATGFDWKTVGFWANLRASSPLASDDGYNFLRIGHPAPIAIQHWEIGNEVYYNGYSGDTLNPETDLHAPYLYPRGYDNVSFSSRTGLQALSPAAYGANAIPYFQAMKAVDPTIQIGVDFSSPGATDPIVLSWDPDLAKAVCTGNNPDLAIIHYYPGTYMAVQPGELLSLPQSDLPRQVAYIQGLLNTNCANASAIKFWLTETSPNDKLALNFPTPVLGLFTLNEYLTALGVGVQNIDWLELHNGTYLDESENPGPSYFGIQLAHQLAGIGDSLVTSTSSTPGIVSYATSKLNGQKGIVLINADPTNAALVQVAFTGATLGTTATQYNFGIATNNALQTSSITIPGQTFTVSVPPYTATELLIQ